MVSGLRVFAPRSNIIRVAWAGVSGATAYRVVWSRQDGKVQGHAAYAFQHPKSQPSFMSCRPA